MSHWQEAPYEVIQWFDTAGSPRGKKHLTIREDAVPAPFWTPDGRPHDTTLCGREFLRRDWAVGFIRGDKDLLKQLIESDGMCASCRRADLNSLMSLWNVPIPRRS